MRFIRKQIREIQNSDSLRLYGCVLALVNALTAFFWLSDDTRLSSILDPDVSAICWPFWEGCSSARILSAQTWTAIVWSLLIVAVVNAAMFSQDNLVPGAYWTLVGTSLLKYAVVAQDFRLTLNHHYMAIWLVATFLLVPGKKGALQLLVVFFYLWAGVLKANPESEWLSGAAFYGKRPLGLPEGIIPIACMYVIVLELVVSFGLLAKREWIFVVTIGQFILFHISSFWVVGFFYPTLMFLVLSIFPLVRYEMSDRLSTAAPGSTRFPVGNFVLVLVFSACQVIPRAYSRDPAMTGEGRIFALNMFDAPIECRAYVRTGPLDSPGAVIPLRVPFLETRQRCDPIVYLSAANNRCRDMRTTESGRDFALILESKRNREASFTRVVDVEQFCASNLQYDLFKRNSWIYSR